MQRIKISFVKFAAFFLILFLLLNFSNIILAQPDYTPAYTCATVDSLITDPYNGGPKTGTIRMVVVYFDFPNGRLQPGNRIPLTAEQIDSLWAIDSNNIEAVARFGWKKDNENNWVKKPMKYTYQDAWNRLYSVGTYYGSNHPDNIDYGDELVKGYGSLREWFSEISYDNLKLIPGVTWPNRLDSLLKYGIVNDTIIHESRILVKPIMLPKNRYEYNPEPVTFLGEVEIDGKAVLRRMFANDSLDFDIDTYLQDLNNKIEFIVAGTVGNARDFGQVFVGFEKMGGNISPDYSFLEGLVMDAHEIGHAIGFPHTNAGTYCIMTPSGKFNKFDCPQHPNIVLKLQADWIDSSHVRKVITAQDIQNLPPSIYNGNCAVLTIYGKPGYGDDWKTHSEYIVFENRRKFGFDQWITPAWNSQQPPPNAPENFNGGCLVWKYSPYKGYDQEFCWWNETEPKNIKLMSPTGFDNFSCDNTQGWGHSSHFFGVPYSAIDPGLIYNLFDSSKTNSAFKLPTGIRITNINGMHSDSSLSFTVNYLRGEPPVYDFVLIGQTGLPNPLTLSGNVFVGRPAGVEFNLQNVIISSGATLDFVFNSLSTEGGYFKALGTSSLPVVFRGAGYSDFRVKHDGVRISQGNINPSDSAVLRYCNFVNLKPTTMMDVSVSNSNFPIAIQNVSMDDTASTFILYGPGSSDRAVLSKFDNNGISKVLLQNRWRFDLANNFVMPPGTWFLIKNKGGDYNEANIEFTTTHNITIDGSARIEGNFVLNRDLNISSSGSCYFVTNNDPMQPTRNKVKFPSSYGIYCDGLFYALTYTDSLIFDVLGTGNWAGIRGTNSNFYVNNIRINNASNGISLSPPTANTAIQYCLFTGNFLTDIKIDDFNAFDVPLQIKYNVFTGNPNKLSAVLCYEGTNVNIEGNTFTDDYTTALTLLYVSNPHIISNTFEAVLNQTYNPIGIYSYYSEGFYSCNDLTNYSDGVLLDNSSPYLLNNEIYNNGYGLYLTNASNPILSPSYNPNFTLYNAGYNKIYSNLNEEIYCNNNTPQVSLPYLYYGYNSIYDSLGGILIATNYFGEPVAAENNFWGGDPTGRFEPDGSVTFNPYLNQPEQYTGSCQPELLNANNSNLSQEALLLGSANIDDYNGNYNSAVTKYKQIIQNMNNTVKINLPLTKIFFSTAKDSGNFEALESYYVGIALQYANDTMLFKRANNLASRSDVKQPEYQEAIDEYQAIINTSPSQIERYYANIDKLSAIWLMQHGQENGPQGNNFMYMMPDNQMNQMLNNLMGYRINNEKNNNAVRDKMNKYKGIINNNTNILDNIRNILNLNTINVEGMTINERNKLIEKTFAYKLFENSLLNYTSLDRPLFRMMKAGVNGKNTATSNIPMVFKLHQNYPNPFNPVSTIKFDIPKDVQVKIKIYDILGREVQILVNEFKKAGYYEIKFDGSNYASGVYFYRIEAGSFIDTKKMVLIK